ncbi:facilitated trehalose transporter Tret1-2 homolog [Drosophila sulfurigaster albostrigata]|uniref:facilitated trehalose transporter Tret1-2 homolog n=1 Tax=Drosophila sulfurigaster albostrigata TaxID=89887 RepID=UPI002D21AF95|nr:facilitated trehalose transporter Tret1-2 homolog [Drosophila sulfurigaster albostrigata]
MSKAKVLPQYIAGLSAAFGAFCMGASMGWSAPVEQMLTKEEAYGFPISDDEFGWISSLLTLGATCVCIPAGFVIDWIGRKPTMLALIPPYMVGWILMIFANNVAMLYFGRFILGVCGGAFCVTASMYTTEISTLSTRGTLGSFFQLNTVSGLLYGYIVGGYLPLLTINILCAILPLIFVTVHFFMPESPVYLAMKNRPEDATKSLKWLRGQDFDVSDELKEIMEETNKQDDKPKESVWKALRRPLTLKGIGIAVILQALQQWTGINAIMFYSTSIFEDVGSGLSGTICTILIGATQVVMTLIATMIIDKAGRRILLLISSVFMAITTCLMGVYFIMQESDPSSVESLGWLPITSILLFIVFFSIGFGPVPWLLMAELFTDDVKSVAGSIAGTSNWFSAFLVTKLFPLLKNAIGSAPTFWIFTVIAIIAIFYCMFFVPETKGKTLIEIQHILAGGKLPPKNETETETEAEKH